MLQSLTNTKPVRVLLSYYLRRQLRAKVNPSYYPSPFLVVDNYERFGVHGDLPFEKEARSCSKLFFGDTS